MLLYAGIDEAGYGPLLGPLCVACVAVEVDGIDADAPGAKAPDLWDTLSAAVCQAPSDTRKRLAIADSKRLKGARDSKSHPLRHLERGVLAALATFGELPETDEALFARLGTTVTEREHAPWYASVTTLPVAHERDALLIAANRLRVAASGAGVRIASIACEALDGVHFNRLASVSQKSDMNFTMAMRHVDALWKAHASRHPRIFIDRQGGRTLYREPLQLSFPTARITILGETESVSRYRLERDGATVTLSFETESESRHLPSALASMTAKYVRELFMERMNRFFTSHLPELKPTAGYVEDGRRYVKDVRGLLTGLGIRDEQFVRSR